MKYISATKEYCSRERHVNAPILRKKFSYTKTEKPVTLEIAVTGFYRVYVNGKDVTKGYFAPQINNPDQIVFYDEYDVTKYLKKENVVCFLLGNGFNNSMDGGVWDFEKASYRSAPRLYFRVYADETIVESDESVTWFDSPITFDDIRAGERFDARLIRKDAFEYNCSGEENFKTVVIANAPKGEYVRCDSEIVRTFKEFYAKDIIKSDDGYVYDFGEINAGIYKLYIDGDDGQRLDLYFGEVVNRGKFDIENVTNVGLSPKDYVQHDVYVCKQGKQKYSPTFTYHGYRYVLIKGLKDGQATKKLIKYVVLHDDVKKVGEFSCSDETLNKIQRCVVNSDLSNLVCIPTDCPQREKNGWTADASLSAEQFLYNLDCAKTLKSWTLQLLKAQRKSGELPGIVPTGGWGFEWGNGPAWDSALVEIPYEIYKFYGDVPFLKECKDGILLYFKYLKTKRTADGLFAFGLGDWCEVGTDPGERIKTPLEVTDSLTCIELADKTAVILRALSIDDSEVVAFGKDLRKSFKDKWIEGNCVKCNTQTAQAFALSLGLFDDVKGARTKLKELVEKANYRFTVGVLGAKRLFEELSYGGYGDIALKCVAGDEFPSYKYITDRGATTLWERFYEMKDEQGVFERADGGGVLSMNHHFWGTVSVWFYKCVAGLKIVDCNEIEISPDFKTGIDGATAGYRNGEKSVTVRWKKTKNGHIVTVKNYGYKGSAVLNGKKVPLKQGRNVIEA